MASEITPLGQIKQCIENKENFVLQGGAGSGKTETLKQTLEHISLKYPNVKVACITHTNLAVEEIKSRIKGNYRVSTIHSFLHRLIKTYKKNIHQVIHRIYQIPLVEEFDINSFDNEKEYNKKRYDKFKQIYEKYGRRLFRDYDEKIENVVGKTKYDKDYKSYNEDLNTRIKVLNEKIKRNVREKEYHLVQYSESIFSDIEILSFSHNDLLNIVSYLCEDYPKLNEIIQDKFDFIFIDEYQDTNSKIIDIFLEKFSSKGKTIIGLFGDSMQSIYDDGIENVEKYITKGCIKRILKRDNYRCSSEVIDFISILRNDNLKQKVALKKVNGKLETHDNRNGSVMFYYAISDKKVHANSLMEDKEERIQNVKKIIKEIQIEKPTYKILMLTNRAIAKEIGFPILYDIFRHRYIEPRKEIEEHLGIFQLFALCELCFLFKNKKYNSILTKLKQAGRIITSQNDKSIIKKIFEELIQSQESAFDCLNKAIDLKLLSKESRYERYMKRKDDFLASLEGDTYYLSFKVFYLEGANNLTKMKEIMPSITKNTFIALKGKYERERFYNALLGKELSFQEILNFYNYYLDNTQYITMHKTKGTGIENVIVVLDTYFWNKYNFKSVFDKDENNKGYLRTLKLLYVAASRTKKNLIFVKLIHNDEEVKYQSIFPCYKKISL